MAMRNVEVLLACYCPCFESVLCDAIPGDGRKHNISVLLSDYVSLRSPQMFLIETFEHNGTVLFTCFQHLLRVFDFDYFRCYHSTKKTYFPMESRGNIPLIQKCYDCYRKFLQKLLCNYQVFYC